MDGEMFYITVSVEYPIRNETEQCVIFRKGQKLVPLILKSLCLLFCRTLFKYRKTRTIQVLERLIQGMVA